MSLLLFRRIQAAGLARAIGQEASILTWNPQPATSKPTPDRVTMADSGTRHQWSRWADRARQLGKRFKRRLQLYRAVGRHPRTPWHSKALLGITVAYALMPFDLIPDWIPLLGYLDDVIILPLLVWLALRSVPAEVLAECEREVEHANHHEDSCGTACLPSCGATDRATEGGGEHAPIEGPSHDTPRDGCRDSAGTEGSE